MKIAIALAVTLGIGAALPAFAASSEPTETVHHHHHYHHRHHHVGVHAAGPAEHAVPGAVIAPQEPVIAPYPAGQGDTDGLSRDPDDCNKGCIGGNPD